ncbi:MAG: hypothetical protein OXF44_04450 [Anaerolineaceae bacterium]|nr:hypothetical protein [Anaerolineaceae bacterium]
MLSRLSHKQAAGASVVFTVSAGIFVLLIGIVLGNVFTEGPREYDVTYLANFLRQTSEDLTSMARLHVVTGEQRYREYFDEILAIRNGEVSYPLGYFNRPYWDLVLATGERLPDSGTTYTIRELASRYGVRDDEMTLLLAAETQSNVLVELENEAMDVVEAYVAGGGDYSALEGDVLAAIQRLHGPEYHKAKVRIMTPLVEFQSLVDLAIRELGSRSTDQFLFLGAGLALSLVLALLSAIVSLILARRDGSQT